MFSDDLVAFWAERHLCTVTTLRTDGSPHVVPMGVVLDACEATTVVGAYGDDENFGGWDFSQTRSEGDNTFVNGGLFVETDVGLPIGTQIDVKLKLPKGTFNVPCEVVWQLSEKARTLGVGVRFLELSAAATRAIEKFMSLRSPVDFEAPDLEDESPSKPGPPPLPNEAGTNRAIATPREGPAQVKPPPPRRSTREK